MEEILAEEIIAELKIANSQHSFNIQLSFCNF